MASSSLSQEDLDVDFELSSRRTRIRTARARNVNPSRAGEVDEEYEGSDKDVGSYVHTGSLEYDASPKPATRIKEKRVNRSNHSNKAKQQRDRRKLREKRRSTGVVHLPSNEALSHLQELIQEMCQHDQGQVMGGPGSICTPGFTPEDGIEPVTNIKEKELYGGSTGEDDDLLSMSAETRRNTHHNENVEKAEVLTSEHRHKKSSFASSRNKSPSDLEADDEDNQDYDSLTMSDSAASHLHRKSSGITANSTTATVSSHSVFNIRPPPVHNHSAARPGTPTSENIDELLERAREENKRLLQILEERDHRIATLEKRLTQLNSELGQAQTERMNLKQENCALIRAMASLTTK